MTYAEKCFKDFFLNIKHLQIFYLGKKKYFRVSQIYLFKSNGMIVFIS